MRTLIEQKSGHAQENIPKTHARMQDEREAEVRCKRNARASVRKKRTSKGRWEQVDGRNVRRKITRIRRFPLQRLDKKGKLPLRTPNGRQLMNSEQIGTHKNASGACCAGQCYGRFHDDT